MAKSLGILGRHTAGLPAIVALGLGASGNARQQGMIGDGTAAACWTLRLRGRREIIYLAEPDLVELLSQLSKPLGRTSSRDLRRND